MRGSSLLNAVVHGGRRSELDGASLRFNESHRHQQLN